MRSIFKFHIKLTAVALSGPLMPLSINMHYMSAVELGWCMHDTPAVTYFAFSILIDIIIYLVNNTDTYLCLSKLLYHHLTINGNLKVY